MFNAFLTVGRGGATTPILVSCSFFQKYFSIIDLRIYFLASDNYSSGKVVEQYRYLIFNVQSARVVEHVLTPLSRHHETYSLLSSRSRSLLFFGMVQRSRV